MINGLLNIPYFAWMALALILAIVWVYVGPHTKMPMTLGLRYLIIRWGHALTWLLLALSFSRSVRGLSPSLNGVANVVALMAGLVYLLFIVTTFVIK